MLMKHINYLIIHGIQTIIYIVLSILMGIIRDKNINDKLFNAFFGFCVVASIICVIIWITVLIIDWSNRDE